MSCADRVIDRSESGIDPGGGLTDPDDDGLSARVHVQSITVELENDETGDEMNTPGVAATASPMLFSVGQTDVHVIASSQVPDMALMVRGGIETLECSVLEQRLLEGKCDPMEAAKADGNPDCCVAFMVHRFDGR